MTPPPERHWRSYGTEPLRPPSEALGLPFRAFPSWFLRIECDRCVKTQMVDESHTTGWLTDADRHPALDAL